MMQGLTDQLRDTIKPFKLGKLDLLQRMGELSVEISSNVLRIENWFDYRPDQAYGDCGELLARAYAKIAQEFPGLSIKMHWGYDDTWFNEFIGWHSFLLVSENPESPSLLVDPGFQRVEPYDGNLYRTKSTESIESIEHKLAQAQAPLILREGDGTFIGLDIERGIIYYLCRNLRGDPDDVLMVTTYRNLPQDMRNVIPVERRTWPISPVPKEIREMVPCFNLAYMLERHVSAHR